MESNERRESIYKLLVESNMPLKGSEIAKKYDVTRQVIVKDIAILRAKGNKIIATPDGYIIHTHTDSDRVKAVIAVMHTDEGLYDEMSTIIKYGGIVEDVIVEHPLYGEIRGMLMVKNYNEVTKFCDKYKKKKAKLLSVLTNGIHLHTISAETTDQINDIIKELKDKKIIISE